MAYLSTSAITVIKAIAQNSIKRYLLEGYIQQTQFPF